MNLTKLFDKFRILYYCTRWVSIFDCAPLEITPCSGHSINNFKIVAKNREETRKLTFRTYLNYLASFAQFLQLLYAVRQQFKPTDVVIALFGWLAVLACTSSTNLCRSKGHVWQNYQNHLFSFLERSKQKCNTVASCSQKKIFSNMSAFESLNLVFAPILVITCAIVPFIFVIGVHWDNPCKPSLIGYFILSECHSQPGYQISLAQKLFQLLLKVIIYLGNIWVWSFAENGGAYVFVSLLMFGSMMTRESIQIFWQQLKHSDNIYRDALVYRQLQIFNILSNHLLQGCVGLLIFVVTLVLSMNLSLLVGSIGAVEKDTNTIMLGLFGFVTLDCVAILFVFLGGMVGVHKHSKNRLHDVKSLKTVCRWTRRYWKSCTLLKTKFGDSNFIEELTPLRCVEMGIQLIVQFLLLSRST